MKRFIHMFTLRTAVFALLLPLCMSRPAHAAPGDLDKSLDVDGKVTTDFVTFVGGQRRNFAKALAVALHGSAIVVAGSNLVPTPDTFALARYNSAGSLLFSTETAFSNGDASAHGVATQGAKIVLAGKAGTVLALARFNTNGSIDTSFDGDGRVTTSFPGTTSAEANAVAFQADGKIVVAGRAGNDFALARYDAFGALDGTFGQAGRVITNFGGTSISSANAIALLSDGRILVVGQMKQQFTVSAFALARYNSNGSLDTTFGSGGKVSTFFDGGVHAAEAKSVAIQADGKIVVAGLPGIIRYNSNGTPDPFASVGTSGRVTTPFLANALAIQEDGRIVVSGTSNVALGSFVVATARYSSTGAPDLKFGGTGIVTTGLSCAAEGNAIAVQKDNGRIVVAGSSGCIEAGSSSFTLVRYHAFECGARDVTILGTSGPDTMTGTEGTDVMLGLGGDDQIRALGGDDVVCGDDGKDKMFGGDGNDTLFGGSGDDTLDGGAGTDIAVDSVSGTTLFNCELLNTGSSGISGDWADVAQHCNQSDQNPRCNIKATIAVVNPRTESTAVASVAAFYLSDDQIWDENDTFLGFADIPVLDGGETKDVDLHVTLDAGQDASGRYVIAVLDFYDSVPEANEENNVVASPQVP